MDFHVYVHFEGIITVSNVCLTLKFLENLFYRYLSQQVQKSINRRSDYICSNVGLHSGNSDLKKNELIILYNSANSPSITLIL